MDKSGQWRMCLLPCPLLPTFKNSHYKMIHNLYVFWHFCKSEISPVPFWEIWLTTLIWGIWMWCWAVFQTSGWGHRELSSSRFSESTWFLIMLIFPHGPVKLVLEIFCLLPWQGSAQVILAGIRMVSATFCRALPPPWLSSDSGSVLTESSGWVNVKVNNDGLCSFFLNSSFNPVWTMFYIFELVRVNNSS